jgi:hypothetical protein
VNLHGLWWQPLPQCKEAKPVQNQVPLAVLMPQMPMPPFGSIFFCVVLVWEVTFVQCSTLLRVSKPYYRWTFLLVPLNNLVSTFRKEVVAILCGRKINYGETAYRFITIM